MNDPFVRKELPKDWIDLGIGEARSVRRAFENTFGFGFDMFQHVDRNLLFEYQPPAGLPALVDHLEKKHQAPVIVTSGAKQGLCASFDALRRLGCRSLGLRVPYWSQLPPAIKSEGLKPVLMDTLSRYSWDPRTPAPFDSFLLVSPGNPDGYLESEKYVSKLKTARIPIIHDAAYASKTYVGFFGSDQQHNADVEIYSFSKMFGLSGLRVGYCVVRDADMYKSMLDYVETKTVGVSSFSQCFVLSALERGSHQINSARTLMNVFEDSARDELKLASNEFKRIKDLLEPHHFLPGSMFGWFKNLGVDFVAAKIHVMDGKHFGEPGYVRINFAAGLDVCRRAVDIINSRRV